MSSIRSLLGRGAAFATLLVASSSWLSAQCTVDPNVGANLNLTDDSLSPQQALGFTFNFGGVNYDSVYVCSNGFVYLFDSTGAVPAPTGTPYVPATATLLASTSPMVCPMWTDFNPAAGGSVHFTALAGKAMITWLGVAEFGNVGSANTLQMILNATGIIDIVYGACANLSHNALVGWSPGNNATDPGTTDLSQLPHVSTTATVYELFGINSFDLSGGTMTAVPTGATWLVTPAQNCAATSAYGRGCPKPADFYELFAASAFDLSTNSLRFTAVGNGAYVVTTCAANCFDTNFATNLNLTDDSLAVGQALGFSFPYVGGSTSTIDVCSNGYIWLASSATNAADYSPTVPEFLGQAARLAPLWMDLNPGIAPAGGGVFFDALPGKALVTWNMCPAFGQAASSNTFQLQLFPNGDFIVAWPQALNNATLAPAAICGFTQGNGVADPGATDLSVAVPFSTGSGTPLRLAGQGGSRPTIGTTFTVELNQVRPGTIGGMFILGTSNPAIDLTPLGLDGCTLLASLTITIPLAPASPITTLPLPVPNDPSLIGGQLRSQGLLVDLSVGAVPAYLSNGLLLTFGR